MTPLISILILVAVAMMGVYVSWRAGRLDRLHARLEAARAALDVALVRRSSVALEFASSGLLDPATSLLLASVAHQVFLARKFYNDAVAATVAARRRPLARLLRLAGGAPLPEFFEIEDSLVGTGEAGQGA